MGEQEEKKEIRRIYKKKRNELLPEAREKSDNALFIKTVNSNEFKNAKIVLAYFPIKNEPDVLKIAKYALTLGKKVAFPVSNTDTYELSFKFISDISELSPGAYSIPEPAEVCDTYLGESDAFCIVPALAFDRKGYRIGYGKGFYDRFLSTFNGISAGLCYSDFLSESLPVEGTDQRVNMIITDKEVLYVKRQ